MLSKVNRSGRSSVSRGVPQEQRNAMKRSIILPSLVIAFVALSPAGVALADNPHSGPPAGSGGQPNQSLQSEPSAPPGLALTTSDGSPNTNGFNTVAVNKYANAGSAGGVHSSNSHVVSQYDVAAFQFSNRGP
jgi:hypothetical protein